MTQRMQAVPLPDECKKPHTERYEVGGVMYPPNTCARCLKWLPPYMAGVSAELVDSYCWGHKIEDAVAPWKQAVVDLVSCWLAYDGDEGETWEADMNEAVEDAKKLLGG